MRADRAVGINPKGLDWRRFIIAVDARDRLVGTGQMRPHQDGSREVASIGVHPEWRKKGVASAIIQRLLETNPGPLYLICRNRLGLFYVKFGYVNITDLHSMPLHFRRLIRTIRIFQRLALVDDRIFKIGNLFDLGLTHEPSLIMRCENKK